MTLTIYHPVGTAKLGQAGGAFGVQSDADGVMFPYFHTRLLLADPSAVVDERLRVFGVRKLRVVDASIMPTLSSGNTHAPVVEHSHCCTALVARRSPFSTVNHNRR
jgi:hypothetical protein